MTAMLSQSDLEALERSVNEQVAAAIGGNRKSADHLAVTGAEVGAFLAMKVVLPIVSSFISRLVYDKYASIKTKKEGDSSRTELLANLRTAPLTQAVSETEVIDQIEDTLASNGVKREQARAIASSAYERIRKLAAPAAT